MSSSRIPWPLLGTLALCFAFAQSARADYRVTGSFQYEDREFDGAGFTGIVTPRPIRFAEVRIIAGRDTLVTGATDENGDFAIVVPGSIAQSITAVCVTTASARSDLPLEVRVAEDNLTSGDLYSVMSEPVEANGTFPVQMGRTVAGFESDIGKAFNIWDVVVDGMEFLASREAHGTLPTVRLTVLWRLDHARSGSFYRRSGKFIYVGNHTGYDDTIILHELGHYVDDVFSVSDSPGGSHSLGDNRQDIRLSWAEGLATFLGSSMRRFKGYPRPDLYVNTDGEALSFSYEIESLTGSINIASRTGSTNEIAVSAALWDIVDGPVSDDTEPGRDDDPLERPFSDFWHVFTRYFATLTARGVSVEDFWDGWFAPQTDRGFRADMEAVFASINGIEFVADAQEGDDSAAAAASQSMARIPSLVEGARVILNELDLGSEDSVELYNAGDAAVNLEGWRLEAARPDFRLVSAELPDFTLEPGSFVILSERTGADTKTRIYLGENISWGNGAGGSCALFDASGAGIDFVRWGDSEEPLPEGMRFTEMNAETAPADHTIARQYPCMDSDSSCDWGSQTPTLGTFNLTRTEVHHTFFPAGDTDYSRFEATGGARYVIQTMNLQSGASVLVDILSADGATLTTTDGDQNPRDSANVEWTAPATGTFLIRTRRFAGNSNYAEYGTYDLRLLETSGGVAEWTSVSPQFVVGGDYETSVIVVNTEEVPAAVRTVYTRSDSRALEVQADDRSDSSFSYCIPALGARRVALRSPGDTASGYAQFLSNLRVGGSSLLRIVRPDATIQSQAGVGLSTRTKSFLIYIDNIDNALSGYAVANDGSQTANLSLTLRDRMGNTISNAVLVIVAGQHIAEFAFQRFPFVAGAGFEGTIEFVSDVEVSSVALRFDNVLQDVFSTIPVLIDEAGTVLYFPQVVDGEGYHTNIILINPNDSDTVATIEFFDDDGNRLELPIEGTFAAVHQVSLKTRGVARILTDGTSPNLRVGWVRVTCAVPLGGSSIFQTRTSSRIVSEAGVASSPLTSRFITYVDSVGFAESGLAISNPNILAVTLTLNLRDFKGNLVASLEMNLPALGHTARFFTQWFPVGFDEFEGTLEVRVHSGRVSAVALRFDNRFADVFATLPVIVPGEN